jgi:hypothetical protein
MNVLLLLCVIIIWASVIWGFIVDDIGLGYFGRVWGALAHGAIAILALGGIGGLIFITSLAIKEIL